ncbi:MULTISPECIES: N-acetylmuramoyl-L-alanine amidase [unclassified Candidatus Frackibacter]|uniref:N-acetylmuramoyl-L-alanine amidase n=1 Tax=unclassified Candidatus Frackibacter TaxID=2648818 RepID=UPI00088E4FF9|nr:MULTISPECIES: N-acetylmuramoyl-L-alanine amidase [unclassified Candidatus Frackibacter]SDB98348.1 Sporulation and spore germination [Candidatus Frackibacter sp. WG11]SEM30105.1 Sporulation and spore germination [Candidatus Frackibacter sp. WG12]SFL35057.1 Sporulation and spore germination [Candidatus Frackibacter sp. WG13]
MKSTKLLVISKPQLTIGIIVIFFTFSFLASGITHNSNFSKLEKLIIIDAGHGGIDDGTSRNGVHEKNINLYIAKQLRDMLEKGSIKTIMTRKADSLYQNSRKKDIIHRAELANKKNADLFVSIHVNSFPGASSFGGQTFYTPNSEKSKALAKSIQEELINIQPENYRQIKPGPYYVLENTEMPAVLVEVGFLSNQKDYKRLTNNETKKEIAKAIKKGIINYLNNTLHLPPNNTPTSETSTKYTAKEVINNNQFKLYFAKNRPANEFLVPVSKEITVANILNNRPNMSLVENLAYESVQDLIEGPQGKENLYHVIPTGTRLLGVKIKNKIAYVNFSENLITNHWGGSTGERLTLSAIVKTLTQFSEIEGVQLLIAGKRINTINGHLLLNHPITEKDLP